MFRIFYVLGAVSIVSGVFIMLGNLGGQDFVRMLAMQVGVSSIVSGVVLMGFGVGLELLGKVAVATEKLASMASRPSDLSPPRHHEFLRPAAVALRVLAEVDGSVNGRQSDAIVDFLADADGLKFDSGEKGHMKRWLMALPADRRAVADAVSGLAGLSSHNKVLFSSAMGRTVAMAHKTPTPDADRESRRERIVALYKQALDLDVLGVPA